MFVATNICRDKRFVATKIFCRDKHTFVATKDVFCRDKHVFVATKIILVASSANDRRQEMGIKCQLALRFQTEGQHRASPGGRGGSGGGVERQRQGVSSWILSPETRTEKPFF